ncbi:MAG: hypothetical protein E6K43_04560 [Gammaproteobacteria bacterium]|nr:MAG: hypothetical protein E6K43_04560 [Gammaproteobacteria bacterium]
MNKHLRYVIPTVVVASIAATTIVFVRAGDDATKSAGGGPSPCKLEMTRALYGFQCLGSAFTGTKLEPVSFVGTVRGDGKGFFEGFGTFNSSNGSASTHVAGNGTLLPGCFGHVDYTTNEIVVPGGGTVPLPPISFDFTVIHGGDEILGAGVAPAGTTGDVVPRLACRLVRVK